MDKVFGSFETLAPSTPLDRSEDPLKPSPLSTTEEQALLRTLNFMVENEKLDSAIQVA
jgi:hypothetical protein